MQRRHDTDVRAIPGVRVTLLASLIVPGLILGTATASNAAPGFRPRPAWVAEGDQVRGLFGRSVATAGDVNGDGYQDVIVGAPYYDNGEVDEGRVFVYYGSPSGPSTIAGWTAESNQASANLAVSAGTAGDVNGDGYDDVIVGCAGYDSGQTDEGRALVYYGSETGLSTAPAWTAEIDQEFAYFGLSVGAAGDVNGDGYGDVIVGAFGYDTSELDAGAAFVYFGSASGLSRTADMRLAGRQERGAFGFSVSTVGDVNGDGYDEVVVGAPFEFGGEEAEGRAYVYHGSPAGPPARPDWSAEGDQDSAYFGDSVSAAGDVNGDGYADLIVGAPLYDGPFGFAGRALVYHGSAGGLSRTADWAVQGDQPQAYLGGPVASAGDVDGDGFDDVIVGMHSYDHGQRDEGRAFAYLGSASGLSLTPDWAAESNQAGAFFAVSVGTAGDVDGDGFDDIVCGANFYDRGQEDEGVAVIFRGRPGDARLRR